MARRRKKRDVDALLSHIDDSLIRFGVERKNLPLREKVVTLAAVSGDMKDLGVNAVAEHEGYRPPPGGARDRLRTYLIESVGIAVDGSELEVVAGISEYARRIRELRVEEGFQIATGSATDPESGIDIRPDEYMLIETEPDKDAARRWHIANRVRKKSGSGQDRILAYLIENVGQIVTSDELAYVSKSKEFGRRTRELRTEGGYNVATRFTGRPDLSSGQYVLESAERIVAPHDRKIPEGVQRVVYERDSNTCRICGWNRSRWRSGDPRILELHHIEHHQDRGKNTAENLCVLCSRCHDEVHQDRHIEILEKIARKIAS